MLNVIRRAIVLTTPLKCLSNYINTNNINIVSASLQFEHWI